MCIYFIVYPYMFYSILSTISALANPPVTGASLVNIIVILTALDIPPEAASLLYAFDWLL
jgi:Na+/H+-dicarboxylate symporter